VAICLLAPHPYAVHDSSNQTAIATPSNVNSVRRYIRPAHPRTPGAAPPRGVSTSSRLTTWDSLPQTGIRWQRSSRSSPASEPPTMCTTGPVRTARLSRATTN